jgi:hypothetical protein
MGLRSATECVAGASRAASQARRACRRGAAASTSTWSRGHSRLSKIAEVEPQNPLPLREREGPIAKRWEGEGAAETYPPPSRCCATGPALSRKGRGGIVARLKRSCLAKPNILSPASRESIHTCALRSYILKTFPSPPLRGEREGGSRHANADAEYVERPPHPALSPTSWGRGKKIRRGLQTCESLAHRGRGARTRITANVRAC